MATPSAIVSRQLGTQFARAAPDLLMWSQERQFFQVQVARVTDANASVQAAVANNVERTIESLRDAALQCASMGLSMNPIAQLVYFIPRRERTFNPELDKNEADYKAKVPWIIYPSPSYRGLAFICTRYAGADDVAAEVVFKADVFKPRGPFALPHHEPTTDNALRTWEQAIGVYAGFRWPGGRERSEYLDANMIAIIREKSDRPNAMMWNPKSLWTEGWKKAAVRRGAKLAIQGNPRYDAAESTMREHEGILIDPERGPDVPRGTPQEPRKTTARPRGMGGLRDGLSGAQAAQSVAAEAEDAAQSAEQGAVAQSVEQPEKPNPPVVDPGGEVRTAAGSSPAGASPRVNSIAWWNKKIEAAATRHDLSVLREEAIAAGVDTGPDAAEFANNYTKRSREIRRAQTQAAGGNP